MTSQAQPANGTGTGPATGTEEMKAYPLSRNLQASIRLNLQHYLWVRALGYLLHPAIPLAKEERSLGYTTSARTSSIADTASATTDNSCMETKTDRPTTETKTKDSNETAPRIMDIGTGTGIWLLDLAQTLPNATLIGTDISASQFPPAALLDRRTTFDLYNVLGREEDVPAHWRGTFDVLHIRLFLLVLHDTPPSVVLGNCLALLKRGGYLQWDEADGTESQLFVPAPPPSSSLGTSSGIEKGKGNANENLPAPTAEKTKALFDLFRKGGRDGGTWVFELEKHFERAGFVDVEKDERYFETNHWQTIEMETSAFGVIGEVVASMGDGEDAKRVRGLMQGAWEECRGGVAFRGSKRVVVVGRKP